MCLSVGISVGWSYCSNLKLIIAASLSKRTRSLLSSNMIETPVSRSNLWIIHSSITVATLGLCCFYLFIFDGFLQIGNLWKSPTIPLLMTAELIKCFLNAKSFKLVARPKHSTNQRREPESMDRIKNFFITIITLVVFFCIYTFGCVIFGAAIIEHLHGTICLSIVLVTFTVLPLGLYLGGKATWELLFCDQFELTSKTQVGYLEYVQNNAMASLLGAWISSIVAPLDWDRDWQNYPIPNVCGAYLGMFVSNVYWLIMGIGEHFADKRQGIKRRKSK